MRVSLATGTGEIVNAGHPRPLRLRDGRVETVELGADLPFGMLADTCFRAQSLILEPGDRLVLVTDGLFERNPADIDIPDLIAKSSHLYPREVVQRLTRTVARAAGGDMRDDATALCLDWYGGNSVRHADSDADRRRTSQEARVSADNRLLRDPPSCLPTLDSAATPDPLQPGDGRRLPRGGHLRSPCRSGACGSTPPRCGAAGARCWTAPVTCAASCSRRHRVRPRRRDRRCVRGVGVGAALEQV